MARGEVVEFQHPKFAAGDKVVGMGGWQISVVDGNAPGMLRKVDTTHVPLSFTWAPSACRASRPGTA